MYCVVGAPRVDCGAPDLLLCWYFVPSILLGMVTIRPKALQETSEAVFFRTAH